MYGCYYTPPHRFWQVLLRIFFVFCRENWSSAVICGIMNYSPAKEVAMKKPVLYIVIPCYNEQEVLPITSGAFLTKIKQLIGEGKISDESRIM